MSQHTHISSLAQSDSCPPQDRLTSSSHLASDDAALVGSYLPMCHLPNVLRAACIACKIF